MANLIQYSISNISEASRTNWNKTSSNTSEDDTTSRVLGPEYHRQMRIFLLTFMIATSLLGNAIMCFHIKQNRRRNQRIQLLFINLAVADLLVTCFTMTSQLVWESMSKEWIGGPAFCSIFKVLQTFTMVCSNYLIVTIALDRHTAIVYPLKRRPNTRCYLIVAWLTSLIPSLPNAYVFHQYIDPSGNRFCVAKFYTAELSLRTRQMYMGFVLLSVFIFPICLIIGLYARILYVLWTRSRAFPGHVTSADSVASNSIPKEFSCAHPHYPRAKIKTLKMTLAVVVTFLTTSLPYLVQEMIIAFGDPSSLNENVVAMAGIFSASNSTVNPYIYLLFNANAAIAKRVANMMCSCCLPVHAKCESRIETSTNAVSEITQRQLVSAWRKLCPSLAQGAGGDQGDTSEIMDEIITTARDLGLERNEDDIEELIMEHEGDLMAEELREILKEKHKETQRNVFPSEKEEDERGAMHLPLKIF
ncbi:oxytocin receptor-like [Stegodyphus dumicola]|uniref:oxytocin receptor-like n=1 Tax=Stegodyphus dumicola TaxID=202533 RepID=UPI0015AAA005|nr:oxytocin receptor-like [Stegodyphus dumicola]